MFSIVLLTEVSTSGVFWEFLYLKKTNIDSSYAQIISMKNFVMFFWIIYFIWKFYYFLIGITFPHRSAESNSCCFLAHVLCEAVCTHYGKLLAGLNQGIPNRKALLIMAQTFLAQIFSWLFHKISVFKLGQLILVEVLSLGLHTIDFNYHFTLLLLHPCQMLSWP